MSARRFQTRFDELTSLRLYAAALEQQLDHMCRWIDSNIIPPKRYQRVIALQKRCDELTKERDQLRRERDSGRNQAYPSLGPLRL